MNLDNFVLNKEASTTVNQDRSVKPFTISAKKYTGLPLKTLPDEEPCEYNNIDYSNMTCAKLKKKISGFASNKRNITS